MTHWKSIAATVALAASFAIGQAQSPPVGTPRTAAAAPVTVGDRQRAPHTIRVATYNIENWRENFQGFHLSKEADQHPEWPEAVRDLIIRERKEDARDNWLVANVIKDPAMQPDVMFVQEGCAQSDAEYFNREFLQGYFETIKVLPTNTGREQNLIAFVKPGFKVIEARSFNDVPDTQDVNPDSDKLFARGPTFLLVETPDGDRLWLGTNHQKSKSGDSVEVARWRLFEARKTHEIIQQLRQQGPKQVVFLGDMNDEIGLQEYEQEAGGDAIGALLGDGNDKLVLATKPLIDKGAISYGGYQNDRYRSFIDQIIETPEAAARTKDVHVVQSIWAQAASDHYPVVVDLATR